LKKQNIGILTFSISEAGNIPLSNLVDVLYSLSNDLYLITGNEGYALFRDDKRIHTYEMNREGSRNVIVTYIYAQLLISYKLIKLTRNVDTWIFFIGGNTMLLPMLTAKLLRKDVVLVIAGSLQHELKFSNNNLYMPVEILENINRSLSNRVVLHTTNLIKEWNLEKYRNKISIAHEYFLDFDKFKIKNKFDERDNLVGYVGRLSEEKGVLNFVKAIPKILKERDGIKCMVGGDGQLQDEIERYLGGENLDNKVKLMGWIPHDELPDYLNELKLLVIPSYTESGPIIALEAMACGTPILATRVGHILNMVDDGETGFIMESNSPECIAENVARALNYPGLGEVAKNARELVEKEFTYEAAVKKYREILKEL